MNEKEALTRVKTGNFNGGHGFDMQLLVDAVGIIGEMFKSGQISEIVRCKDCRHNPKNTWIECPMSHLTEEQRPETAWCFKGEKRSDE